MQAAADIMYRMGRDIPGAHFSILIPTWNNLACLKVCIQAIRTHSSYPHQIILHINDGRDGTREWAEAEGLTYSVSDENVGICYGMNAAAQLATTGYLVYLNDDMYVLPGWDRAFQTAIDAIGHRKFFLSGTMIEPEVTGNTCAIQGQDYGRDPLQFREAQLLHDFSSFAFEDWNGATWPPNLVPRELWDLVGGYSVEFSPGMASDPDFSMKLWMAGVRHFQGLAACRVYHFQARSTGRVQKNNGSQQFLEKYGITQSTFSQHYLRRGEPWKGPLTAPAESLSLRWARLRSELKRRFS